MAAKIPYNSSGFFYVRGRELCLFSNGVALGIEEFHDLDSRGEVIQTIVQRKNRGDKLYDFEYACEEGVLRETENKEPRRYKIVGNNIREVRVSKKERSMGEKVSSPPLETESVTEDIPIPSPSAVAEALNVPIAEAQKEVEEVLTESLPSATIVDEPPPIQTDANPPQHRVEDSPGAFNIPYWKTVPFMVELVMLLVAGGSAVMSAYHTTTFMVQSGKPLWVSFMTGTTMILFSATAFTAARYFFMERGATALYGVMFTLLGVAIVCYSMFSTITVNYNQFQWEVEAETAAAVETSTELSVEAERTVLLQEEMSRIDTELERLREEAEWWRNRSWAEFRAVQERINEMLGERGEIFANLQEAGSRRLEAEGRIESRSESIYGFLSALFSIGEDLLRFIILVIPSVWYDFISPLGFSIVLLLEDKRRKRSVK